MYGNGKAFHKYAKKTTFSKLPKGNVYGGKLPKGSLYGNIGDMDILGGKKKKFVSIGPNMSALKDIGSSEGKKSLNKKKDQTIGKRVRIGLTEKEYRNLTRGLKY